jgi:hypothetical protein
MNILDKVLDNEEYKYGLVQFVSKEVMDSWPIRIPSLETTVEYIDGKYVYIPKQIDHKYWLWNEKDSKIS